MALRILPILTVAALLPCSSLAQVPAYYPSDYSSTIDAAKAEGKVVIYGVEDVSTVQPLIDDFKSLYPGIVVEYNDFNTFVLQNRFISEAAAGSSSADVVWSSGMDLQVRLVEDGYALSYKSPEAPYLPSWAVWKDQAYGTTFEPVVFVYNKSELSEDQVPHSHADLAKVIADNVELYRGRIVSYDIEKSGVGFLTVAQDNEASPDFWSIPAALGKAETRFVTGSAQMIESVGTGENVFGFDQMGSYVLRQADNPDLGVVLPTDFTLVTSRIAFIAKRAPHPNAAKLWLDYMLSQRGQTNLTEKAKLYSLRPDVAGEHTAGALTKALGSALRPVQINADLTKYLDADRRTEFLSKWHKALEGAE